VLGPKYIKLIGYDDVNWTELSTLSGWKFKKVFEDRVGSDYDSYKTVYKVDDQMSEKTIHFSIEGYYSSNDGVDYDYAEMHECEPKEIITIEYNPVKKTR
jgi:hypothetical protein